MSHFSIIKINFQERKSLIKALEELGFHNVKVGNCICRGYSGNMVNVDILIPLSNGYDIGFIKKDGSYQVIADWWGIRNITESEFIGKLNQQYSLILSKEELKKKGFSLKEEKLKNGTIRLIARRLG